MDPRSRSDWRAMPAPSIPSKTQVPALEHFLSMLPVAARVLDLGCGNGAITHKLHALGHRAVGVDLHEAALAQARALTPAARFFARDVAGAEGLQLPEGAFDAVICQLLLSVVGDAADRAQTLVNARALLAPQGRLYASLSGLSDDLNPEYAALYARDLALTGEHGSYLSRDADGRVLYRTHHFSRAEIEQMFQAAGLRITALEEQLEASSRRPEQRARFFYVQALSARTG